MNSLLGHIKWLFRSPRTRRLDEMAMIIADRYGMRKQYLEARKFGFEPLFALEEFDLGTIEERALFLEPYNATTAPQPLIAGKDPQIEDSTMLASQSPAPKNTEYETEY